jgi:hypothetical protein
VRCIRRVHVSAKLYCLLLAPFGDENFTFDFEPAQDGVEKRDDLCVVEAGEANNPLLVAKQLDQRSRRYRTGDRGRAGFQRSVSRFAATRRRGCSRRR